ncbi:hypothetical protein ACVW1A_008236 [Bradyrhizobium sp. LB1.3]|uniref:ABC transporter substrate binding protein n=1 Tax=unclassified Bradyrhizobium TaxID=2631580 RepID=UPI003393EADF
MGTPIGIGADGQNDRLPALVAELIHGRAAGPSVAAAAKRGKEIVPVVFTIGSDPVQLGLVASLNRPGANVTGTTSQASAIVVRQLEAARELRPSLAVVGCLVRARCATIKNEQGRGRQASPGPEKLDAGGFVRGTGSGRSAGPDADR